MPTPPRVTGENSTLHAPTYRVLALCKNRAAYEAIPEHPTRWDLDDVAARITHAGYGVLANAKILLAARIGPTDASIFESGKVLLKTRDPAAAKEAFDAFCGAMGWAPTKEDAHP